AAFLDLRPWIHATSSDPVTGAPVAKSIGTSLAGVVLVALHPGVAWQRRRRPEHSYMSLARTETRGGRPCLHGIHQGTPRLVPLRRLRRAERKRARDAATDAAPVGRLGVASLQEPDDAVGLALDRYPVELARYRRVGLPVDLQAAVDQSPATLAPVLR